TLYGEDGDDILEGNDGNDVFDGGNGRDRLRGNAGDDFFDQGAANNVADQSIGDAGTDKVGYNDRTGRSWTLRTDGGATHTSSTGRAGRCLTNVAGSEGKQQCPDTADTQTWKSAGVYGNDGEIGAEGDDVWSDVEIPQPVSNVTAVDIDNTGLACDGRDLKI